ncbi:type II secretion system F family protein [Aestuariimicrobium kwangyangense]|uniref:type II secretion system F family protein n=1 Tax=Aestuariimicrobium kwangyangense TaxID=396389 RepID=UPI0003B3C84F|nr:type II secretion system F family protein [Aestuariimicrobium kwangyangense]
MLPLGLTLLGLGLATVLAVLFAGRDPVRVRAMANLQRGRGVDATVARRQQGNLGFARWIDTPARRGRLELALAKAGFPSGWTVDQLLSIKVLGTLFSLVLATLAWATGKNPLLVLMLLGMAVLAFFLPDLLLYNTFLKRREQIDLELADTLDQMSIAVQAGLGFDAAMLRVARNGRGVLAGELIRTMQDVQVGQSRRSAYEDLARRTGSDPLRRFVRTVIQAESYGIPLADVLTAQSDEMRIARRQMAEKKAMEIPVKVVFPLILCILPVIFLVILGPAAISIIDAFTGVLK